MTLSDLDTGDFAEIVGYAKGNVAYRAKLLALGLTRGVRLRVVNVAPLGDPFEIAVRGYHLSLRREEVKVVSVKRLTVEEVREGEL